MKPASGMETYSTGMPARAQSTTFCEVAPLHLSGAVGQHENTASGRSRKDSAEPRAATSRSRITGKPSALKAPVITGFSQYNRLR